MTNNNLIKEHKEIIDLLREVDITSNTFMMQYDSHYVEFVCPFCTKTYSEGVNLDHEEHCAIGRLQKAYMNITKEKLS